MKEINRHQLKVGMYVNVNGNVARIEHKGDYIVVWFQNGYRCTYHNELIKVWE